MASNIALAGIFTLGRRFGYWLAAPIAVLAKFAILTASATVVLSAITHGNIGVALASMMGWPQLITGLLGAGLVYALFKREK
jgi:hypothetical protein